MMHFVRLHNTMPPCYEGRETFKCEIEKCGYIFLKKHRLDCHMKKVHGGDHEKREGKRKRYCYNKSIKPGTINCPQCNKPMSSDHKLKRHINTMHGDKIFQCSHCQKRFCTKGNLNMHINSAHIFKDGTEIEKN